MLSEEKIKIMTSLARFEKHEGKRIFSINRYFKGDYIGNKLFQSFFSYTLSFVLCLVLWGLYYMERWLTTMDVKVLTATGIRVGIIYLTGLVIYLGISFLVYRKRYEYAARAGKVYLSRLKRLDKRYEGNTRPLKRTKGGRTL
ncbi:hypothetical protein [Lacrimispora sp. JR3]|uniref:hypothetical protein n=1 Tax=Lacrimispora sinapis TaxID=3111456 RepID=UPI0037489516